jgi:hypothetical protein
MGNLTDAKSCLIQKFQENPRPPLEEAGGDRQVGVTFYGHIRPDWFGCYSFAMLTLLQVPAMFSVDTAN